MASEHTMLSAIEQHYEIYSEGWNGRVDVGAVTPVKAKAPSKP
jgi:hypothetical protein